jgi:predicted glycosyltransferase
VEVVLAGRQRGDVHPARLHDALAGADLLVADTQTMVTEAALLGTPAIRSNSFVGDDDMGNFLELERRNLVENLASFEAVLDRAVEFAADPSTPDRWRRRRDELFTEVVNPTDILVAVAENTGGLRGIDGLSPRRRPAVSP